MRVVAGTFKGRSIKPVKGMNTRPTTDKVKESIFNIIGPYFDGGVGLDLFGGSGNLGIESLSRGIEKMVFVDKDFTAFQTIKENLRELKLDKQAEVYKNDAFKALNALAKRKVQFDLILLDPPYKGQKINEIIEFINEHEMLAEDGIIMAEYLKEDTLHNDVGDIHQVKRVEYGITAISIFERYTEEVQD
ncbi:MAG TPA: 16S rRNA (guanine(966)-N(2))-methyltransferase RsmD [Firmicutes bacterium]|nr:16S rRNA (guanine(966)-N(2))-methyltransferase RsmD [Bacillota bacterium]